MPGRVSGVVVRDVKVDEVTTPIQLYQTNLGHPCVNMQHSSRWGAR